MKRQLLLCAIDYSDNSEPVLSLAVDLAKVHKSKVYLLHVKEPNVRAVSIDEANNQRFQMRLQDQSLNSKNIEYEHVVRHGDPADETIKFAKQHAVDLIVMGTHGRTGLANLVVGSVARKVMAGACCPVVTIKTPKPGKSDSKRKHGSTKRFLRTS